MTKLLFFGLVGVLVYLIVRASGRKARVQGGVRPSRPAATAQAMVACAHCGVHQPVAESLLSDGQYYCCEQHRALGPDSVARGR